jgi:hypothetical protein
MTQEHITTADKKMQERTKQRSDAYARRYKNHTQNNRKVFSMQTPLKTELYNALRKAQPDIQKDYLYHRCVDKYLNAILPAIRSAIATRPNHSNLLDDQFNFSHTALREVIGTIGKSQRYIYQLMRDDKTTSLLVDVRKGYSKNGSAKLSVVRLNPLYEDLVLDALLNVTEDITPITPTTENTTEPVHNYSVFVDPASLASFIAKSRTTLRQTANDSAYARKLLRNIITAQQLQSLIQPATNQSSQPFINERWTMADSGRIYGTGLSLQRIPKEVRHAALGYCHKYDFRACAFALMGSLAKFIDPTLKIGALEDYISHRSKIRTRIADQLDISVDLVKTLFTALGFGAELKNTPYAALRGELAKAARQRHDRNERLDAADYKQLGEREYQQLIQNDLFIDIYNALQRVNQTILNFYADKELQIGDRPYLDIDPKTNKRRSNKQKLAWIYQALESVVMLAFVDYSQQEPLLTTHDCIYYKKRLTQSTVDNIYYQLREAFPLLSFEHEEITPIAEDEFYQQRYADVELFEREHREHIAREEVAAKENYAALRKAVISAANSEALAA